MATSKHDDKPSPIPHVLVALGILGVAGSIGMTTMKSMDAQTKNDSQSIDRERPAKDLALQQHGELVAPAAWADKNAGLATVPIDRAMGIVVKTLQANPAAATPPPPEPPAAADAGAEDAAATDTDGEAPTDDTAPVEAPKDEAPKPEETPKPAPEAPKPAPDAPKAPDPTEP